MTSAKKRIGAAAWAASAMSLVGSGSAMAEVTLANDGGWQLSTDGRVNTFLSVAIGTGLPDGQPDFAGAGTTDTKDAADNLRSARIDYGEARLDDPNIIDIKRPRQAVNFINAGMTISW